MLKTFEHCIVHHINYDVHVGGPSAHIHMIARYGKQQQMTLCLVGTLAARLFPAHSFLFSLRAVLECRSFFFVAKSVRQ